MAMIHMEPQTLQLFERVLGTLKPPPNLTLSQWADKYRRLSAEASSAKGQWNTDNAPFQREIMDAIGDVHIRKVVAMMCAQAGKTEGLILNTVGFYMSYYPAPIMIVQPTVNLGESFSKDRLATMIRDTPILRGLVDNKSRYSGNTITKKNFPGGQLTIIGANSPTDLRGRPIKVLLADEVDAYKASAGKEGDPIMLAEERQTTYWDHKTVLVSTPTTKASSRILDEFNASTQEEWNIPCPNCGKYQPFVWDGMVFDKEKWPKGGVQYRCAECGCLDNEFRWKKNSIHGKWVATHPERKVRGFHMNKMGSTLCGWNEIVEKFIAADLDASRGDYEKMQVFVNTNLGLPWEEPGETVETTALIDRREFYEAEVPDGVLYLTCGIDTQDNRFEAEVVGWGIGKESWGIRYQRIYGDLKRGQSECRRGESRPENAFDTQHKKLVWSRKNKKYIAIPHSPGVKSAAAEQFSPFPGRGSGIRRRDRPELPAARPTVAEPASAPQSTTAAFPPQASGPSAGPASAPARQSAPNRLPVRNLMLPLPYKPRSHEMVLEIPPRL